MSTPLQFAARMQDLAKKVEGNATDIQRLVALAVDQAVVLATPVANPLIWQKPQKGHVGGRARYNWVVGLGTPNRAVRGTAGPGGGSQAIAEGAVLIKNSTPHQAIYISNSVAYIMELNRGHSKQAPAGFIELAVSAGSAAVRGASILR